MITLAAYGIRKAYKKQQAKKAHKEQLERENQDSISVISSEEQFSSASRQRQDLPSRPVNGGFVDYAASHSSSLSQAKSSSPSSRTTSMYSQNGFIDPREEMRQYQEYIQQQSYGLTADSSPPSYEIAVERNVGHPWKSPFNLPARNEDPSQVRDLRHIPQDPHRVVELDTSSESSPSPPQRVPLHPFHPPTPITNNNQIVSPITESGAADDPDYVISPIDGQRQPSMIPLGTVVGRVVGTPTESERAQLKRQRSESGSEIESEDNKEVIVRFREGEKLNRSFPRRVPGQSNIS